MHELVPEQAPPQPENVFPVAGVAVRVTLESCGNVPVQVPLEQLTPVGLLVTVPLPVPPMVTFKELEGGGLVAKAALTEADEVERATTHELVPEQAPAQPEKVFPVAGVAVRVTLAPCGNVPVQVPLEQVTPVGLLVTVPLPLIEIDSKLSGPAMALDTSGLGELSFPDVS